MLILSRTVRHGDLVRLYGKRIVRYSGYGRPIGVYQPGSFQTVLNMDGNRVWVRMPEGIVMHGPAFVNTEGE